MPTGSWSGVQYAVREDTRFFLEPETSVRRLTISSRKEQQPTRVSVRRLHAFALAIAESTLAELNERPTDGPRKRRGLTTPSNCVFHQSDRPHQVATGKDDHAIVGGHRE